MRKSRRTVVERERDLSDSLTAQRLAAGALTLGVFVLYALTLFPSVAGGDAGELTAAAATRGVPHPPGYPLFALLVWPFTLLPIGTVAWRANLASALFAAVAAGALALAASRAGGRWWAGVAAGGAFAFSPTVWLYAIGAEVFSLNNLLVAIELLLVVEVYRSPQPRYVYLAALVFGLGLSNHHTSAVVNGILLAAAVWRTRDYWFKPSHFAAMVACGAAGLLPYLYLPLAAAAHPPIAWGDTATFAGFLTHVLRRDYGTFQLAGDTVSAQMATGDQLGYYVRDAVAQLTWIAVGLAVWGFVSMLRSRTARPFAVTLAIAFVVYLGLFHSLANLPLDQPVIHGVVARFWQLPNMLLCVCAGYGIAAIRFVPVRIMSVIAVVAALAPAVLHFRAASHRHDLRVHDYASELLRALPPNALVLTRGDPITNPTRYLHVVERVRPDVRIVDREMLTYRWMAPHLEKQMPDVVLPGTHYAVDDPRGFVLEQLVDANIGTRPVVTCGQPKPGDTSVDKAYRPLPLGFCNLLVPLASPVAIEQWEADSKAALPVFRNDMRDVPPADSWERVAWDEYWNAQHNRAVALLTFAIDRRDDPRLLRESASALDALVRAHPFPPAMYFKNLGIASARLVSHDRSFAPRAIEAFNTYLRTLPASNPEAATIRQVILELSR